MHDICRWGSVALGLAAMFSSIAAKADPKPSAPASAICAADDCGLDADGPFPEYVIGRLAYVGTVDDVLTVKRWARAHGKWADLPGSDKPYASYARLVMITADRPDVDHPVTVFLGEDEFGAVDWQVGDFVRYSPHRPEHEIPPLDPDELKLYHGLTGCVAILCRKDDQACAAHYIQGVFDHDKGTALDLHGFSPIPQGRGIDPGSLLPAGR